MLKNFLKSDGERYIFTGHLLELYIPEFYFPKLANNMGDTLNVFGLLNLRIFDNKGNGGKIETLNIPSMIYCYPSEIEKRKIKLLPDSELETYYVAIFNNGDPFTQINVTSNASNAEYFLDLLIKGKIPNTIPYTELLKLWKKNLSVNKVSLGVTSTMLEVIITEIYRNKNKPEETFAKVIGKNPNVDPCSYERANIREICARNSTFAALTFEDMDNMIAYSLNINKYNKEQTESPIEKIIKM